MRKLPIAVSVLALAVGGTVTTAQAASGGEHLESNPGIVALTDSTGNQLCSAVLVDQQWALTFEGPMTCAGATQATADSHDRVDIDKRELAPTNDPAKGQAMLVHFADPVQRVSPAELSTEVPKEGETLQIVAFNGPEGINHLLSLGRSDITVKGHNEWLSWYGAPESMSLETGKDSGAPILRDGKVVAFTGLVTDKSADAEDVANVSAWVEETIGA